MSLANSFSRLALKQFVSLLEGETVSTDLEEILWTKIQAQPVTSSGLKIPVSVIRKALKKSKIEFPYMPSVINYNIGCTALKVNGGLYIPCCAKCAENSDFCAACEKHEAKYGVLSDRGEIGTYVDPSDKHETSYGTWLSMNGFTIEDVTAALKEEGFEVNIPRECLTVNSKRITKEKKSRKGRPKSTKKEVVEDSSDEAEESEEAVEPPDFGSDEEGDETPPQKPVPTVKLPTIAKTEVVVEVEKPVMAKLPALGAKSAPEALLTAPAKSDSEEEEPKKTKKSKPKAVVEEAKVEEAKGEVTKKPKKSTKFEAKEENSDEESEEKPKKTRKPKKGVAEESKGEETKGEEEPKKPKKSKPKKAETDEEKDEEPKKARKPKKAEAKEEPKSTTEVASRFSTELGTEEFEEETTFVNGVSYKLKGKCLVSDDGEIAGRILDDGTVKMESVEEDDDDAWSNAAN